MNAMQCVREITSTPDLAAARASCRVSAAIESVRTSTPDEPDFTDCSIGATIWRRRAIYYALCELGWPTSDALQAAGDYIAGGWVKYVRCCVKFADT